MDTTFIALLVLAFVVLFIIFKIIISVKSIINSDRAAKAAGCPIASSQATRNSLPKPIG